MDVMMQSCSSSMISLKFSQTQNVTAMAYSKPIMKIDFSPKATLSNPVSNSTSLTNSFGLRSNPLLQRFSSNDQAKRNVFQKTPIIINSHAINKSTNTSDSYRPVVILPGLGNNTADYNQLVLDLESKGLTAKVAQVSRPDWLRNASGLLTSDYWKGTLKPLPVLQWYLERVENVIQEVKKDSPDSKVSILGHSAGGWLARLYMFEKGIDDIHLLLSLGTPHLPPPRGIPGVVDQTRGLLYFIEENFPGAFYHPHVKYVCIAGRYMKGSPLFGKAPELEMTGVGTLLADDAKSGSNLNLNLNSNLNLAESFDAISSTKLEEIDQTKNRATFRTRIIGQGYKQVCGQAEVWGDGVVPEISAFLEGANNISLEGVYHSPVGANEDHRPWYGSKGVLDKWAHHLFD